MTVLNGSIDDYWHAYKRNTGKGVKTIIRKANSVQTSPKLKEWQRTVAEGRPATAAKRACLEAAKVHPEYLRSNGRCKKVVLKRFLELQLKQLAAATGHARGARPP
ncbi:hypothetical protein [Acidilobus sp.]|uniref:hypothetical protein n=1 Tax=Acidilobus sp. TaxID=1872109 RepID=UPI003D00A457